MTLLDSPGARECDRRTTEAFADPQVGDRFHEMCSVWWYVVAVEPEGRVAVLRGLPPCTLPRDGKLEVFETADAFRGAFAYGSIPGYSVSLADRGNEVEGWFPGWPEPEPEPEPEREPDPLQAEVDALAQVITDAKLRGIEHGHWSLAREILAAGYRKMPEPPPLRYGECRACEQPIQLNEAGCLIDHDDKRRGRHCIGARNTPLRLVDAPEVVAVDAR